MLRGSSAVLRPLESLAASERRASEQVGAWILLAFGLQRQRLHLLWSIDRRCLWSARWPAFVEEMKRFSVVHLADVVVCHVGGVGENPVAVLEEALAVTRRSSSFGSPRTKKETV